MQLRRFTPLLLLSTLVATAACVEPVDDDATDDTATSAPALNGPLGQRPTGNPVTIPVCWWGPEDPLPNTLLDGSVIAESTLRGWARDVVEGQWSRYARVNFTGWGTCGATSPGVRLVLTQPTRPGAPGWDSGLAQPTSGDVLLARDGINNTLCRANATVYQQCVKSLALHTFGHVLGFNHQENRVDYVQTNPHPDCRQLGVGTGDQRLGAYDLTSIMSTCGQPSGTPSTFKTALSPADIAAAQAAFGRRVAGQMASIRGADMLANNIVPNPTFLWDADEAPGQLWTFDWARLGLVVTTGGRTGCLDAFPSAFAGSPLVAFGCFFDAFQTFRFDEVSVRGFGGLCLDAPSTASFTELRVATCTGEPRQRWAVDTLRRLRLFGTAQCATYTTTIGAALTLMPCGFAGQTQDFTFAADGSLRFGGDRCVDAPGPTTTDYFNGIGKPQAGRAFTYYCGYDHMLTQRWNLSGRVTHSSGLCMDNANSNSNGSIVSLRTCNNGDAQRWDYYWR